jgi:hypothetical protein
VSVTQHDRLIALAQANRESLSAYLRRLITRVK